MAGGAGNTFDRLVNSELGQRLLAKAEAAARQREGTAHAASIRPPTPHREVIQRKISEVLRNDLITDTSPAITKFDAVRIAVAVARETPRDFGLRRAALHLHKVWEGDKDGNLTVADLTKLRAHFSGEYPKSGVRDLFDRDLPKAGFHTLPLRRLAQIAASVRSQADYDSAIETNGLAGSDHQSRIARAFILALVNRQAGDAADAGEQEFHPDVNEEQGEDAVDADKVMKARRADKPSEPEFKPSISTQHPADDQEGVHLPETSLTAQVESDEPEDAELGEEVEQLVRQHDEENAPAEMAEGRGARRAQQGDAQCRDCGKPMNPVEVLLGPVCGKCVRERQKEVTGRISRSKVEDVLLSGKPVVARGFTLRIASRSGQDQVEMVGNGEPPMAWPLRKLTAAVEYFAQALESSDVNEQQPDAVKPPSAKSPLDADSSSEDIGALEPSTIEKSHPAQDQAGTSEPPTDLDGVNEDDVSSLEPSGAPKQHHPADDQAGTSFADTDLGHHSSGEEPPVFNVNPITSREGRTDRRSLRAALRGIVKRVAEDEDEEVDETDDEHRDGAY
jgi:hypothetical protein